MAQKQEAMDRRQSAPSTWNLERDKTLAAKKLVEWNDEGIACNWTRASRTYLFGSAFEGYTLTNLSGFGCDVRGADLVLDGDDVPITVNRVRALGKAFVAKTGANDDPVPQFVTNDGTYDQQQAAKNMDDVVCSEYSQQQGGYADFHALCRKLELMVTTALGRGWIFVFPGTYGGRVKPEAEIDDGLTINVIREHQYGRIIRLSRSTWRDPEALIAKCGKKHKQAILDNVEVLQPDIKSGAATKAFPTMNHEVTPTQRLVRVVQGWSISLGKNDPGRELFTLKDGHWLEDNKWERASPPGRHIDYEEELSAAGGTPLTQTIYRLFCREQELIHDVDQVERNMPIEVMVTRTGDPSSSGTTVKKQLESAKGIVVLEVPNVEGAVQAMEMKGLPRKSMELLTLYSGLQHEIPGISRGHADATQQKNVSSGIQASLEASLFPELHADFVLRFNRFRAVDCAELFVWAIQDIVENGDLYSIWAGDDETKRMLKGDDLDLDMQKYKIAVKAASARKDSPASRLAKAEKWLTDPTVTFTGADMAQFWKTEDVDRFTEELDAITEGVRKQIRKWRSLPLAQAETQYRSPAKWMTIQGLESALRVVVADYEDARDSNVPEPRLRLWENYMNQCTSLIRTLKKEEAMLQALAAGHTPGATNGPAVPGAAAGAAAGPGPSPGGPAAGPGGPPN